MKKLLFAVFGLVLLFAACKKDEENKTTCNPDMASYSGTYKVSAATYKLSASAVEQDYYNQLYFDPCMRDDFWDFNISGAFTFTDAGVKCVPARDGSGTWSVNGNLHIVDGKSAIIESFDCTTMVLSFVNFKVPDDQLKLTFKK